MSGMTPEQIAHIKQYQARFDSLMTEPTDVEEYAQTYAHVEELYESLCAYLGLTPQHQSIQLTVNRGGSALAFRHTWYGSLGSAFAAIPTDLSTADVVIITDLQTGDTYKMERVA